MKITAVHTDALSYPVAVPFANSRMWNRARTARVAGVVTEAGGGGGGCRAAGAAQSGSPWRER